MYCARLEFPLYDSLENPCSPHTLGSGTSIIKFEKHRLKAYIGDERKDGLISRQKLHRKPIDPSRIVWTEENVRRLGGVYTNMNGKRFFP